MVSELRARQWCKLGLPFGPKPPQGGTPPLPPSSLSPSDGGRPSTAGKLLKREKPVSPLCSSCDDLVMAVPTEALRGSGCEAVGQAAWPAKAPPGDSTAAGALQEVARTTGAAGALGGDIDAGSSASYIASIDSRLALGGMGRQEYGGMEHKEVASSPATFPPHKLYSVELRPLPEASALVCVKVEVAQLFVP